MLETRIEAPDPKVMDSVAQQCGELAIGCTDAGGKVQVVAATIGKQIAVLGELEQIMASLETDQRQVTDATDEARLLSESARKRLHEGRETIAASIEDFAELTALVTRLGGQITSFASAMDQVRRTTETIDAIARTTNMLALNAAIEAEKAGDAGRTFAVVAAEVKKLARDTRAATEEIGATMASLTREAEGFVSEVRDGASRSREAERGFARVNETVADVTRLVEQVDAQADDIARATNVIHGSVCRVGDELGGFSRDARANNARLDDAFSGMGALERRANAMFDTIVQSGFAPADRFFVDIAIAERDRFVEITRAAIDSGKLTLADLFDTDYRPIAGSNPPRFDNRLNEFADFTWRPELDRIITRDPRIVSSAATDINGYLPTHTTRYSRAPNGDPVHDAANCRNRRILSDDTDLIAKASTKPFHVAVYRRESDGGGFHVVRNAYVPMIFDGRRWGDLEIAYRVS